LHSDLVDLPVGVGRFEENKIQQSHDIAGVVSMKENKKDWFC